MRRNFKNYGGRTYPAVSRFDRFNRRNRFDVSDGFDGSGKKLLDRDWFDAKWTGAHYFNRDWFDATWIHRYKFGGI